MPPKTQFITEDVIQAAYEILKEDGLQAITARHVAEHLNSSVGPIYSTFENIDELKAAALGKAAELLEEFMGRRWTNIRFLNMGVGFVQFAKRETRLFTTLFFGNSHGDKDRKSYLARKVEYLRGDPILKGLSDPALVNLFTNMSYFAYGMAAHAALGRLPDDSDEYIVRTLYETGSALINKARLQEGLPDLSSTGIDKLNIIQGVDIFE